MTAPPAWLPLELQEPPPARAVAVLGWVVGGVHGLLATFVGNLVMAAAWRAAPHASACICSLHEAPTMGALPGVVLAVSAALRIPWAVAAGTDEAAGVRVWRAWWGLWLLFVTVMTYGYLLDGPARHAPGALLPFVQVLLVQTLGSRLAIHATVRSLRQQARARSLDERSRLGLAHALWATLLGLALLARGPSVLAGPALLVSAAGLGATLALAYRGRQLDRWLERVEAGLVPRYRLRPRGTTPFLATEALPALREGDRLGERVLEALAIDGYRDAAPRRLIARVSEPRRR